MTTGIAIPLVEPTEAQMQERRARQGLLVFAGFLIPLSILGYWFYIAMGDALPIIPSLHSLSADGAGSWACFGVHAPITA